MRRFIFTLLIGFLFSATASAQTRQQAIDEFSSTKQKPFGLEKIILSPDKKDFEAAVRENAGVFRLLPREKYDKGIFEVRGGGAYYSFVKTSHNYNDTPQLTLEQNFLGVGFYGASYGLIGDLGLVPLSGVTVESEEVKFLAGYQPPTFEAEIRAEQKKAFQYDTEKATYRSRVPVSIGHSYALRAISFGEADVLVAFKIERKDTDGSVIVFWKMLKQFPKPILIRADENASKDGDSLEENILKALRAKGFNDVTIDTSTKPMTVRGTFPKDKIAEMMTIVMEANGGRPVQNQATGK